MVDGLLRWVLQCIAISYRVTWLTTDETKLHLWVKTSLVVSSVITVSLTMSYFSAVLADERPHLNASGCTMAISITYSAMNEVEQGFAPSVLEDGYCSAHVVKDYTNKAKTDMFLSLSER